MNKVIMPGFIHVGEDNSTEFTVKLAPGGIVDLKFNGKPEAIVPMIYEAMNAYEHIAHTVISAVLIFADQKKIPLDQLVKHSFIETGKIITPKF